MHDLVLPAIPFFVLFLVLEIVSFRHIHEDDDLIGYERSDTATSLTMGLTSVVVGALWGLVAIAVYAGIYTVSPWHLPTTEWWTYALLFLADDLAFYWYHRVGHEVRVFWAAHVVHHSSQHFNLSTALRQPIVPMTALPFWAPCALFFPPWMIFGMQSVSLIYQFGLHTERIGRLPGADRVPLQHALAPPRAPRRPAAVPRPQLRRHPDHLGPPVRHVRARGRARALRPDQEPRDAPSGDGRDARVEGRRRATCAARAAGASGSATCSRARLDARGRGPRARARDGAAGALEDARRAGRPLTAPALPGAVRASADWPPYPKPRALARTIGEAALRSPPEPNCARPP